jgi:CheY-like chemotaxis protein
MKDRADFTNLRALIVGGKPHAVSTLRTVLGVVGMRDVQQEGTSARAIERLRSEPFDVVFCDEYADTVDSTPFAAAARRAHGVLNPMLPIFLVFGSARRRQVERARDDGVTDVLTRPISAATIIRKLNVAVVFPRAFIAAPEFFGPDRRAVQRPSYRGDDRRKRVPKKIRVTAPDAR